MKEFRWFTVCLAACICFSIICGCSSKNSSTTTTSSSAKTGNGKSMVVGFSQIGAESAWRTAETQSVKDEAKRRGVTLNFADAQQKQENQISAVKSFIAKKVDIIFLAPVVETGWEPVLKDAKRAGIPVVLLDRGVEVSDDSLYATLIGSDFVEEGRMAAEWLAKKTDGKCQLVELQGTPGSAPAIDRNTGFMEVLKKYPDMKIIKSQSGDFTRSGGKAVMEAFIKSDGKKIQAVYSHNDDMAIGAIQALEEVGMEPGKKVTVISVDGVKAAFEAMIAGKLNATVECNPILGPMAFDVAEKVLSGESVPKKFVIKDQLFEMSTAAEDIKSRKY